VYLEIDEGFATHRKTLRFCALMMDHNAFAYVLRLWTWACRSAPDGDLSGMEAMDIEIAVQYRHNDGKCYTALVKAGFIDEDVQGTPSRLHKWMERTGGAIRKMADEAARKKAWRDAHGGQKCTGKDKCQVCADLATERPRTVRGQSEGHPEDFLTQTRPVKTRPDQTSFDPETESSKAPPAPSEPPLLVFPCVGNGETEFGLTRTMVEAWSDAWPGIDVLAEAKKALAWVNANPSRRKTHRGMPAFLTGWCNRAQDKGGTARAGPSGARPPSTATRDAFANLLSKATP
jgi:hypothetical protein